MSLKKSIFLFLFLPFLASAQKDSIAERFARLITPLQLEQHLNVIASDAYEGRETGRKGQKMAADYIRNEFKKLHLKPGNDTSYFQTYPLVLRKPGNINFQVGSDSYTFKKDFYYMLVPEFHDQVIESSDIVFLSYGISDSLYPYNDYKGHTDLKGKVIMIFRGEPFDKDGKSLLGGSKETGAWTQSAMKKLRLARNAGARAVLIVSEEMLGESKLNSFLSADKIRIPSEKPEKDEMPVFYISMTMGNRIAGKDLAAVKQKISKKRKPVSFKCKEKIKINIHRDEPGMTGENVIGILEGTTKKDEYIFITAHYDHLGVINNQVYNGADDDGSGTVSVMTLARAFCKAKEEGRGPERSIVFMTVSGEEKGLLGSGWFVEHPTIPLAKIVCDLNIDMIGRVDDKHLQSPDYVYIIGSDKLSSTLHKINEKANAEYTHLNLDYTYNDVNDPNRFYYRSDHYNFAKNNIPVIFYFNGTHADYHQETDETGKINYGLMAKRGTLVFMTAWDLANRPDRIVVDSSKK